MKWLDVALEVALALLLSCYYVIESIFRRLAPVSWIAKDISSDKVLITGGGSGLGRLTAKGLAKLCTCVVVLDINEEANNETVKQITSEGGKAYGYKCDIRNRQDVYRVAEQVKKDVGQITILVNNAGIVSGHDLLDTPDESILKTFDVNVLAHFWTIKSFLPGMMEKNRGHIVTIASLAGHLGVSRLVDYCSSKYAAVGLDDSLRAELFAKGYDGIHTTCICPYYINTGMFEGVKSKVFPILEQEYVSQQIINSILKNEDIVYLPRSVHIALLLRVLLPKKSMAPFEKFIEINKGMSTFKGRQLPTNQSQSLLND